MLTLLIITNLVFVAGCGFVALGNGAIGTRWGLGWKARGGLRRRRGHKQWGYKCRLSDSVVGRWKRRRVASVRHRRARVSSAINRGAWSATRRKGTSRLKAQGFRAIAPTTRVGINGLWTNNNNCGERKTPNLVRNRAGWRRSSWPEASCLRASRSGLAHLLWFVLLTSRQIIGISSFLLYSSGYSN